MEDDALALISLDVAAFFLDLHRDSHPVRPRELGRDESARIWVRLRRLELADDGSRHGERVRVVHEDRILALRGGGLAGEQREERPGTQPIDDVEAAAEAAQGLLLHLGHRRARQNVVELAEQQRVERPGQLAAGPGQEALDRRGGEHLLGRIEAALEAAMRALHRGHRRVAPRCPGIEVRFVPRQRRGAVREPIEVVLRPAVNNRPVRRRGGQRGQRLQVLSRRTAPMVADAPQQQAVIILCVRGEPPFGLGAGPAAFRVVVLGGTVGQHRGAVVADPHDVVGGQAHVLRVRTAEEVARVAAFREHLHQAAGVAEGIDVEGHARSYAKAAAEVAHAGGDLPDERLSTGQVAVRLHVPAADDVPAPRRHEITDPGEERGLVLLDPLVEQRFVVAEGEALGLLAERRRGPERGERGGQPFFPGPQPHGVQVRVADEDEAPPGVHAMGLTRPMSVASPAW